MGTAVELVEHVGNEGDQDAESVGHAAGGAGEVDDESRRGSGSTCGHARERAREHGGRHISGAGRPDGFGQAGQLSVEQRPSALGRPVARPDAGAARRDDDASAGRERRPDRVLHACFAIGDDAYPVDPKTGTDQGFRDHGTCVVGRFPAGAPVGHGDDGR